MALVRALIAVVLVLVLGPRVAAATEGDEPVPTSCGDARELLAEARTPIAVEWMASPAPSRMPGTGSDDPVLPFDLCFSGSLDEDCRLQDPSFPPAPGGQKELTGTRTALVSEMPALPEPDAVRRPHARTDAGEARQGFVRDLFRPPRA